ncbi:MAG: type IV secretory system conjugative DNA transfer family protein [Candidatus Thiodiazotropha sp. (ex Lucinoma aequizonata)]|nr:type IV secretory system conjugative DNA transfer family protein [Candidatus Thiodiazotropha sp. (ex Lucinoma aequizonata)]MCU7894721.1 type IV secretory system conjugative DNA transfer family protein [Candidatus Thiodiazotropha sp. (ex Lucinoma aequizonata)]MCU7897668.1 type IV secretory system conjugative DNA transfer family protein [Candidatus Thiodiazotropha sp. (ex Lucinoma aequizonata)]
MPFKMMGTGAMYLLKGHVLNKTTGADFATKSSYRDYLSNSNKGLLLDGGSLHLSEPESFQNVCVMARVGAGKTSRYIIPNVLDKARKKCSMVINDPKGEVFSQTSAYLEQCGYKVIVIDPENLSRSSYFNPLEEAKSDIELEQVAEILVRAGIPSGGGKDDFWLQGAIRFASLFIKCLKNAGAENPDWFNLHNLYYLFQNFGQDGAALDDFMTRYTIYPDNPEDESLWNEWKGVLTGNPEGVQSFVLNAITSLKSLSNQNVAKLTAKSDLNLEDIRREKTVIYLITPAQHAEYYSFLTSLFFRSVFNACMRKIPDRKTLPVYILYDEFGHSSIPNFVSTANTIRAYKVSLSIILQSISQLNARYGKDYADSIHGGFNTYLTYAGADPQTASFFENIIGRVRERQKKEFDDPTDQYREYNLLNASEVRTIASDETLIVSSNRQPVRLKTTPYFENWTFKRQARKGACSLVGASQSEPLKKVGL